MIQNKSQADLTQENTAICIKSPSNLQHFIAYSDANSTVICVKLQRMMNGITIQDDKDESIEAIK